MCEEHRRISPAGARTLASTAVSGARIGLLCKRHFATSPGADAARSRHSQGPRLEHVRNPRLRGHRSNGSVTRSKRRWISSSTAAGRPAVCSQRRLLLGHRRLSIIDLSTAGHQPMVDADSGAVVTYNGEIYNYLELRQELESRGHRFRSATDTEVLLKAYLEWARTVWGASTACGPSRFGYRRARRCFARAIASGQAVLLVAYRFSIAFASEPKAISRCVRKPVGSIRPPWPPSSARAICIRATVLSTRASVCSSGALRAVVCDNRRFAHLALLSYPASRPGSNLRTRGRDLRDTSGPMPYASVCAAMCRSTDSVCEGWNSTAVLTGR